MSSAPPDLAPARPRVLSGMQPTSDALHLGNWMGAVRSWVAMQDDYDCFYFVADLHALSVTPDPAELRRRTRGYVAQWMALGLDPTRCTIFVQSQVPEHVELGWVLMCLTGYGEASRMTQFKDKVARAGAEGANVGLFAYPSLMAADVLLYQPDRVPVGEDQRQHLELSRHLVSRFNHRYGETFRLPEPLIPRFTARLRDLAEPTAKMSSSHAPAGTLSLLDEPAVLRKKVRAAVTDTGRDVVVAEDKPGVSNLVEILAALSDRPVADVESAFSERGYGDLKVEVAEAVLAFVEPVQERHRALSADPGALDEVIAAGAERAGAVARETMAVVRERVGLLAAPGRG